MPQVVVNLTLAEIQIALARYVLAENGVTVIPESVNFEAGNASEGQLVSGACYRQIRTPREIQEAESAPATQPIFKLVAASELIQDVCGSPESILDRIDAIQTQDTGPNSDVSRAAIMRWMRTEGLEFGQAWRLRLGRDQTTYWLQRER